MNNRSDFQRLAKARLLDAKALFRARRYTGAYYLAGYTIECALKACIAKQTKRFDAPNRNKSIRFYTHNLKQLRTLAALDIAFDSDKMINGHLETNWNLIKDWEETSRYETSKSRAEARELLEAVEHPSNGILPWIKKYW